MIDGSAPPPAASFSPPQPPPVDAFDMFSASPVKPAEGHHGNGHGNGAGGAGVKRATAAQLAMDDHFGLMGDDPNLVENWDDGEGYYVTRVGETVGGR